MRGYYEKHSIYSLSMSMGVRPLNKTWIIISIVGLVLVIGTLYLFDSRNIQKVGILFEHTTDLQPWEQRGYVALLSIGDEYDADVYVKQQIHTENEISNAVESLASADVHLLFGHSHIYGRHFVEIAPDYPNIHFIYFNGGYSTNNVTSISFEGHAMGFFGGMVAARMTETDEIGIIAAFGWQAEVEGFYEGVKFQNPNANVHIKYTNDWNAREAADNAYDQLKEANVDVFYPASDTFSNDIVARADEDELYAIGYVENEVDVDERTVLTSTLQHVDKLYVLATELYHKNQLSGGVRTFDFADDVVTLGPFSPDVPNSYVQYIEKVVEQYKETGLLPNEK